MRQPDNPCVALESLERRLHPSSLVTSPVTAEIFVSSTPPGVSPMEADPAPTGGSTPPVNPPTLPGGPVVPK